MISPLREWKKGISDLDFCEQKNTLPQATVIGLKIILLDDEQPHHYSASNLWEERAVRRSAGGAVRVMKGVYIGGSQAESHDQLRRIDDGQLLLTNQRLIFNGNMRNLEYKLNKIISIEESDDGVEVASSNRKKVQIFTVEDPHKWATYIRIAVKKYGSGVKKRTKK